MNIGVQGPSLHFSASTSEEYVTCNSCRMKFDAVRRRPLSLQCLHCYCELCIAGMTGGKHGKKVTCSRCHKTTKLNKNQTGSALPVNYAILETLSQSSRAAPVTVFPKAESPLPLLGNAGEKVTVIPVNNKEYSNQMACKENRLQNHVPPSEEKTNSACMMYPYDDRKTSSSQFNSQCNGTTSISIGERLKPKDCLKPTAALENKPVTSPDVKSSLLPACVTVTSLQQRSVGAQKQTTCQCMASENRPCSSQTHLPCSVPASILQPPLMPVMTPYLAPTVTSLTVKSPGSTPHLSPSNNSTPQTLASVDLCCQCRIHPATLSLTSANQMSSQKLCSSCFSLIENRLEDEQETTVRSHITPRRITPNQACSLDSPATTVVKVLDERPPTGGPPCQAQGFARNCELAQCMPLSHEDTCHRGSIHVDGMKATQSKPCDKVVPVEEKTIPCDTRVTSCSPKVEEPFKAPSAKPSYQACSKFDLRTDELKDKTKNEKQSTRVSCPNDTGDSTDDEATTEEIYRPLPYNPDFINGTAPPPLPLLDLPPEAPISEPLYPPLPNSNAGPSSGFCNEKHPLSFEYQASVPQYPSVAPPRYEEIIAHGDRSVEPKHRGHSVDIQLVYAFGRYGELATQPGAFRSPGRINISKTGIVVVTDSFHKTIQAFTTKGECLALIRVNGDGVSGCSCYDNKKLAVGTSAGVLIYDFNGVLKKTIPLGPVFNTIAVPGNGFIAVQAKALTIFRGPNESLSRTLRGRSKPGPTRQLVPFDCITDAAVNSQKDLVVLDAGAASGLGTIFILSDDGYLKSSIVPGKEPCGVLRQPTAIAVDHAHNIIVSDTANRRILLFGANGRFNRQLLAGDSRACPLGIDVADDGRLFIVSKGDRYAEVRVFTYN